ncbi:MAG: catalase [Deltaproteobacteria bacterium]|nr:catalase [Deltaproteobacteria bacterium]
MTEWKETIAPDEEARFEKHAALLAGLQKGVAKGGDVVLRALHAKSHAGVTARLEVLDAPAELKHGLFAAPATYAAYVRFSSGTGFLQPDTAPDIRGVAIKVLGVAGAKVIPGLEKASTQDFLFIQTPANAFVGPDDFVRFVHIVSRGKALALPRLIGAFGWKAFGHLRKLMKTLSTSRHSFAHQRFYTALPLRYGPHACKLDLRSVGANGEAATKGPHGLAEDLAARLAREPLTYELGVQLFVDEARTPIEDASVAWDEAVSPFRAVARLTIPTQQLNGTVHDYVEKLAFDPWHALVEHRPLGAMMRARNHAYRASTMARRATDELTVEDLA